MLRALYFLCCSSLLHCVRRPLVGYSCFQRIYAFHIANRGCWRVSSRLVCIASSSSRHFAGLVSRGPRVVVFGLGSDLERSLAPASPQGSASQRNHTTIKCVRLSGAEHREQLWRPYHPVWWRLWRAGSLKGQQWAGITGRRVGRLQCWRRLAVALRGVARWVCGVVEGGVMTLLYG